MLVSLFFVFIVDWIERRFCEPLKREGTVFKFIQESKKGSNRIGERYIVFCCEAQLQK